MKMKTKQLLFVSASFFLSLFSHAQFKLPGATNPDLRNALEKVIGDFPKEFANLKGEVLNNNPQTVEYASLLPFKTAEQNTITKYSGKQPIYSWQAQMLTCEDFEAAAKKYKALYGQLKNTTITLNRDYTYGLASVYDAPDETRKFSSSIFTLQPNASNLSKVKVELSMQYEFPEWKIYLIVYQKEREDADRGKVRE